jgi:hypothetical protein
LGFLGELGFLLLSFGGWRRQSGLKNKLGGGKGLYSRKLLTLGS